MMHARLLFPLPAPANAFPSKCCRLQWDRRKGGGGGGGWLCVNIVFK
jgi:hypothetical protein